MCLTSQRWANIDICSNCVDASVLDQFSILVSILPQPYIVLVHLFQITDLVPVQHCLQVYPSLTPSTSLR